MKNASTITLLLAMTGLAVASSGIVHAESDEDKSGSRYAVERHADALRPYQQDTGTAMIDSRAHWQVTDAAYDQAGRLSLLRHIVPLHDMDAFGRVTSGIVDSGLKLDRVDAVFNEADHATPVPHYHFTQRFL